MKHPQDVARLKKTYFSSKDQLLALALALGIGPDPKQFQVSRDNDVRVVAHLRNTCRSAMTERGWQYCKRPAC
jgi:hypothetical protein